MSIANASAAARAVSRLLPRISGVGSLVMLQAVGAAALQQTLRRRWPKPHVGGTARPDLNQATLRR